MPTFGDHAYKMAGLEERLRGFHYCCQSVRCLQLIGGTPRGGKGEPASQGVAEETLGKGLDNKKRVG